MSRSLLIAIVAGLAGLWALACEGPRLVFEAGAAVDWPTVAGEVTSVDVERRSGAKSAGTWWAVVVRYRYTVDGATHDGDRFTVAGARRADSEAQARAVAAAYVPGAPIEVRYDPSDSASAVLSPGGRWKGWLTLVLGALLLLVAARAVRRVVTGR